MTTRKRYAKIRLVHTTKVERKKYIEKYTIDPLEKKPNGDSLEIEKYQKVNQKRFKN